MRILKVARKSWSARDRRMNLVNELFQNIRFLKFYGWGESVINLYNEISLKYC